MLMSLWSNTDVFGFDDMFDFINACCSLFKSIIEIKRKNGVNYRKNSINYSVQS